ncbi:ATP-binding protein [Microcoleus sp. FACHB-SPT15]|uniref:ATP-binding protein n=1 Tax=Microcoleus sp. FACHB-SPT15 TaxID=2692830 RepID=UPI00177EB21E|nr:ATP-binding protein [Microcoleus sp. FACHB-SPT15]MBD1807757.1 ATP-binding protein [Microcoleus sp. FACHB-SPT15]
MTSIDNVILKSTNPFDNYRSVNFWQPQKQPEPVVESIHQDAIATIEETLDQVVQDHCTRTVMLQGDPGSGKTYLLGRLKKKLNHKAFFVYIKPFPQSDRIWRHILRYTVDSMIQVPEGQKDSQLMLWLKSLSAFTKHSLGARVLKDNFWELFTSDRKHFINHLKNTYKQAGIYNADNFFGVLHDLTNPELYTSACQWLQGDDLSEESLKELGVKGSIDTEEAASETLANFGRISAETQPIVLCFDQLESIARLLNGSPDLQTLFSVKTKIHDENNNFLIIISITTDTWRQNESRIDQSHKARIDTEAYLKPISLKDAEFLLATRLSPLHHQANSRPNSPIYPLTQQVLGEEFKRGKTNPREALMFGRDVVQDYKKWLAGGQQGSFKPTKKKKTDESDREELLANFKLKWIEDFNKVQQRITKVRQESSPELIQMLQEGLTALQAEEVKTPLLTGTKFASHSLSYKMSGKPERIGVVWTEDQNMGTFFHVMEACRKAVEKNLCQTLYLVRAEGLGKPNNKGYKLYTKIFTGSPHHRITPNPLSVQYLVTYYDLVKDAREGDFVIRGETIGLKNLQALIRESEVLQDCPLLQDLEIVPGSPIKPPSLEPVKDFLLNFVITQQFLGRQTLIQNASSQFPDVDESQIDQLIDQLCQEDKIQILDPRAKPKAQLVCLVPKAS